MASVIVLQSFELRSLEFDKIILEFRSKLDFQLGKLEEPKYPTWQPRT